MAKKRKASNRPQESSGPNLDVGASRKRIKTFEDVADSDDEFHLDRDQILLDEGPEARRRRKVREEEGFLEDEDEEVLGLGEGDDYEDEEDEAGFNEDAAEYDSDEEEPEDEDGQEDGLGWGTAMDEIYGADEIETEEQALEEEAEALRLQKKQLQAMSAADFGFDESEWQNGDTRPDDTTEKQEDRVVEILPQLQIGENTGPAERLKMLKTRYPEFEHLRRELPMIEEYHRQLLAEQKRRQALVADGEAPNLATKLRATSAYAGALVMYFALLASPAARSGAEAVAMAASLLRDHPIMETLVKCKDLWMRARNLPADPEPVRAVQTNGLNHLRDEMRPQPQMEKAERAQPQKSRAQRHAEAAQQAAHARRAERMHQVEADLADLNTLTQRSRGSVPKRRVNGDAKEDDDSDVGKEATPLTAQEAAQKAQRKKSLRFYASQITQKANKRGAAGRNAGGDDDIPYRERLRDRQARLNAEAEKRGQRQALAGDELGGASDEEDARLAQDVRGDAAEDDYYDLIAGKTARKKADKAAFTAAQKEAALQGGRVVPQQSVGADGKRKITYAIEKNKGLTPHRKKEARNPRVKKRKKFEEKKKKLASVKAVYRGGEGRGGYGGELTGIKKGLVKSVKL